MTFMLGQPFVVLIISHHVLFGCKFWVAYEITFGKNEFQLHTVYTLYNHLMLAVTDYYIQLHVHDDIHRSVYLLHSGFKN